MAEVDMMRVTRAGANVGTIRASHVADLDRARYELAHMMGVHAASVLRGHAAQYSDGSMSVQPIGSKGERLGRPYFFTPYRFTGQSDGQ